MSGQALAIPLAAPFTFGWAAIHAWCEHAPALTPPLAAALICLTILAGSVAIVKNGGADGDTVDAPLSDGVRRWRRGSHILPRRGRAG